MKMRVIVTEHAKKRLREERQEGITIADVARVAKQIPGNIPIATRFRSFQASSRRIFDIVAKDVSIGRLVITIIGK